MVTKYFESFISKLREIFMMDETELDFGIYRIMNQKRDEINDFLSHKLLPQVEAILSENSTEDTSAIKNRLKEIETNLGRSDVDSLDVKNVPIFASMVNEYHQLKKKLANTSDAQEMENDVFSHLTTFFSRYYDGGDFISQRRYKDNTYAIPYNGEEVKLYWANADQYYIKTSESFRIYSFILPKSQKKVNFIIHDADEEQNNNKPKKDQEYRFKLYEPETEDDKIINVNNDGDLNIYFTFSLMPKSTKQEKLCSEAESILKDLISEDWSELLLPYNENAKYSILMKELYNYTSKNSFDYFIHKNLGKFLKLELDFYIKNEIIHIDDLDVKHVTSQLTKAKAVKQVGQKIIEMLAQLENFQKKLWLKKKFVLDSNYCITLDRIPKDFYPDIIKNEAQVDEWIKLFKIDKIKENALIVGFSKPLSLEFLNQNQKLVLDTKFFSQNFKHRLISKIENLYENCSGLLIDSENFQALNLLQETYKDKINAIYIDPPYNVGPSEILYKNNYKDSSWLTLMHNRLQLSNALMSDYCGMSIAIDDYEMVKLSQMVDETVVGYSRNMIVVNHHPQGSNKNNISRTHEYALVLTPKSEEIMKIKTDLENAEYRALMRSGTGDNNFRYGREKSFYAVLIDPINHTVKGVEPYPSLGEDYPKCDTPEGWKRVYPISKNGDERVWRISSVSSKLLVDDLNKVIHVSPNNTLYQIINSKKEPIGSNWTDKKYNAGTYGTNLIKDMFGTTDVFSYPKSLYTVEDYLKTILSEEDNIVLDYFAGSGTTGHAAIDMTRNDGIPYRYILCEMGKYFYTATKPRIEKAIYSNEWSNGKPQKLNGISHCFKYIRLEQYEDTLNNLEIKDNTGFNFEENDKFHESYMLRYMLDTETKDSLFNLKWFENPFAMTIKTTKDNELVDTPVDMVETFNYLIGLNVKTIDWFKDDNICVVEGTTHKDGYKTLVIWRNCNVINNEELNKFFDKMDYRVTDSEYDLIYVNGDNTLPNLRKDDEHWKVILTEEEFAKRMFEDC